MLGVVAIIKVKEGGGPGFEAVFSELAQKVREHEPGNYFYSLFRSRTEPNTYRVVEKYQDQAALEAHRASAHFQELRPKMGQYRDGDPTVEYFDAVE